MTAAIVLAKAQDPAGPPAAAPAEAAPRIAEIVFEGADPTSVRALVDLQPGALLDARDVRDAVRALHGSARFSRVEAYVEPSAEPNTVRLVFVLQPIEKLVSVSFPGHEALADSILHQTANLQT